MPGTLFSYQQEPLRIFEVSNWHIDLGTVSSAEVVESVCQAGANVQHMHCMKSSGGLDEKGMLFATKIASVPNKDYLKDYVTCASHLIVLVDMIELSATVL